MNIKLITQNAIRIEREDGKIIYIDPFELNNKFNGDANYIFITHSHYDHFSPDDIEQIKNENTKIIVTTDLEERAKELSFEEVLTIMPNEKYMLDDISFETIPAYNIDKQFHKREYNWVGYILEIDGKKVYIAGDTDATEEAKNVICDIAMIPIGGTYTMNCDEASELVKTINPKDKAIPTHYGSIVGTKEDGQYFKNSLEGFVNVEIYI